MRALIVGATGIVGQHMRLHQPAGVQARYVARRSAGLPWVLSWDAEAAAPDEIESERVIAGMLQGVDAVVNLAGQGSTDEVERDPERYRWINETFPGLLARLCDARQVRLVHVSSQGALGGRRAPYPPMLQHPAEDPPVNEYGRQKRRAEWAVLAFQSSYCWVARLTFVLGVRPFPNAGRANPLEQALAATGRQRLVADRWFSPCFAAQAAGALWDLVVNPPEQRLVNVGVPARLSRADVGRLAWMAKTAGGARLPGLDLFSDTAGPQALVEELRHDEAFPELAQRPKDTTYLYLPRDERYMSTDLTGGLLNCARQWRARLDTYNALDRAAELAAFFGTSQGDAAAQLALGFGRLHNEVTADFRRSNPRNDTELLNWYRRTDAYCWELTAYHLDAGFNYRGMCEGIRERLLALSKEQVDSAGPDQELDFFDVLCLGDGVGDLTLALHEGRPGRWRVHYHDLRGSRTAELAEFRFHRRLESGSGGPARMPAMLLTTGWEPPEVRDEFDAVVALDFFEHMPNVEEWARFVAAALKPGGVFMAQNAFAQGDEEHGGDMPMHLSRNNKFADPDETGRAGWDSLLLRVGLERADGGWWRRP